MKNEGKCADEIGMELYNYLFSLVWIQIRYNTQKTFLSIFDLSIQQDNPQSPIGRVWKLVVTNLKLKNKYCRAFYEFIYS